MPFVLLLLLNAAWPAASASYRFGVSLSLSGELSPCHHCEDAQRGLRLWQDKVNDGDFFDIDGERVTVVLVERDDGSNESRCIQNYEEMAQDNGTWTVHFLFGPSNWAWGPRAASVAASVGMPILLWAFEPALYDPVPMSGVTPALTQEASAQLTPLAGGTDTPSFSAVSSDPSYVLDLNIPAERRAANTLHLVKEQGVQSILFAWFADFSDAEAASARCAGYVDMALAMDSMKVYVLPVTYAELLATDVRVIQAVSPDAVVFCGQGYGLVNFVLGLHAFKFSPLALVADTPPGSVLAEAIKAYNANYMVEPLPVPAPVDTRPCPVFSNYSAFVSLFADKYAMLEPGYGALQAAAAGVLFVQALQGLATAPSGEKVVETLKARPEGWQTFFGTVAFNYSSQNQAWGSASRQFLPLGDPYSRYDRYTRSRLVVASEEALLGCLGSNCDQRFAAGLSYPAPDWTLRHMDTYPCEAGCLSENVGCVACQPGRFRSMTDLSCRPCPVGTFAPAEGLDQCQPCPHGALCDTASQVPVPMPGFMVQRTEGNASVSAGFNFSDGFCFSSSRTLDTYTLQKCEPPDVCLGGDPPTCKGMNMGALCGQCPQDYTHEALLASGLRNCVKCPSSLEANLRTTLFLSFLVVLVAILYWQAKKATHDTNDLTCPMTRAIIHHAHVLGLVVEVFHLDASPAIVGWTLPFHLACRPTALLLWDCAVPHLSHFGITRMRLVAMWGYFVLPVGFIGILVLQLLTQLLFRLLWRVVWLGTVAYWLASRLGRVGVSLSAQFAASERISDRLRQERAESSAKDDIEVVSETAGEAEGFSVFRGPGLAFYLLHERLHLVQLAARCSRQGLAWTLLAYPWALHALVRARLACLEVFNESRLLYDLDVMCGSDEHVDAVGRLAIPALVSIVLGVPALLLTTLLYARSAGLQSVLVRSFFASLYHGYRPSMWMWEVVLYLRTGVLSVCAFYPSGEMESRFLRMAFVLSMFFALELWLRPYESRDRRALVHFSMLSYFVTGWSMVAGATVWPNDTGQSSSDAEWALHLITVLANSSVILLGLRAIMFNTTIHEVQAFIDSGSYTNRSTFALFSCLRLFHGFNPLHYYKKGGSKQYFVDTSSLNDSERRFLVRSLSSTLRTCVESSGAVDARLLAAAIHEAFVRAIQARKALLRSAYAMWGTRTHPLSWVCCCRWMEATLRSPDIPPSPHELQGSYLLRRVLCGCLGVTVRPGGASNWRFGTPHWQYSGSNPCMRKLCHCLLPYLNKKDAQSDEEAVDQDNLAHRRVAPLGEDVDDVGVTIEEFHTALQDVNREIRELSPAACLLWRPTIEEAPREAPSLSNLPLVWYQATPLSVFEQDLYIRGSADEPPEPAPTRSRAVPAMRQLWTSKGRAAPGTLVAAVDSCAERLATARTAGGMGMGQPGNCGAPSPIKEPRLTASARKRRSAQEAARRTRMAAKRERALLIAELEHDGKDFKHAHLEAQSEDELTETLRQLESELASLRALRHSPRFEAGIALERPPLLATM